MADRDVRSLADALGGRVETLRGKGTGEEAVRKRRITDPPKWRFRQMVAGEENEDPIHGEFFTSDKLGDLADVLVRESVQNSLDAVDDGDKPVTVRIHVGSISKETPRRKKLQERCFNGLWEHLTAQRSGLESVPDEDGSCAYIAIEDFNTVGLRGDPSFDDVEAPLDHEQKNHFFYFWRNIGRSQKGAKELGSWGVGKQVFPACSAINAFFGLSRTSESKPGTLMGKAVLKIHHAPQKCAPYGYWANFDEDNSERPDFPLPIRDESELTDFGDFFGLTRDKEPGLSIVVPRCKIDLLNANSLSRAAIRHYFYPILSGRLVVEVREDPGDSGATSGQQWKRIDASSIESIATGLFRHEPEVMSLIDLASWAMTLEKGDHIKVLEQPDLNDAPDWHNQRFSEDALTDARAQLETTDHVALRIPVRVKKKEGRPKLTWCKVYFGNTHQDVSVKAKYIREEIDVINANTSKVGKGVAAMLEVDDPNLGELLRNAEPPAHDRWETRAGRLSGYDKGAKSVRFVIHAPHQLWERITEPTEPREPDLLKDFFFVDLEDSQIKDKATRQGNKDGPPDQPDVEPPPPPGVPQVRPLVSDGQSGFELRPPSDATEMPASIRLRCAYETASGDPFKNYSPLDFRLHRPPVVVECTGLEVEHRKNNTLELRVTDSDYRLTVLGFDPNRDLRTSVQADRDGEEGEA
mgnify:CR=1 FL=1